MGKVKRILINLLVILISFLFIDGGKTVMLIGNNIQIILTHNHTSDLEIPHQQNFAKSDDDEKWIKSNSFEILSPINTLVLFHHNLNLNTEEYVRSVWQPPKSL